MMPINRFLAKIRWDKNKNPKDFSIGIFDRMKNDIFFVRFEDIEMNNADRFSFSVKGREGRIPFHRIRIIKERGKVVWERPCKKDLK